jgi:iron complex outermembrane receptor protein
VLQLFTLGRYKINEKSRASAGIRYDVTEVNTEAYTNWFEPFEQRAFELNRNFQAISWSVGYNMNRAHSEFKFNLGKSFRMPLAKELTANGFNYHLFREEIGDSLLKPEINYQLDFGWEWHSKKIAIGASPFISYFTNAIYLSPEAHNDTVLSALQPHFYRESEVLRYGGEVHSHYTPISFIKLGFIAEYVYSLQTTGLKQGYTLPYAPQPSFVFNIAWTPKNNSLLTGSFVSFDFKHALQQSNIMPSEKETPSYNLFDMQAGTQINLGNQKVILNLQIRNVFNTRYLNHSSYYRIIDLPEAGRDMVLNIQIPIKQSINNKSNTKF